MATLKKNGNVIFKNYFDYTNDAPQVLKKKRGILAGLKLDTPFVSWPKDKVTLLALINSYVANYKLDKLSGNDAEILDNVINAVDGILHDIENKEKTENDSDPILNEGKENIDNNASESSSEKNAISDTENHDSTSESKDSADENIDDAENSEPEDLSDMPDYMDESEYAELPGQLYDIEDVSAKMLGNIVRILNYRSKVLKKIKYLELNRAPVDMVNEEIEKIAVYNIVLAKYLPILNKQKVVDTVNLKNATAIFDNVCTEGYEEIPTEKNIESEIKKNKETQDFDIVSALNYVGVAVDKDENGMYYVKNTNNGNGIKYYIGKSEKTFSLSKSACSRFLENFLNKPIETRKFITPGQVFITYINEAEKSLGINTRNATELNDLFGAMNSNRNAKAYFKDAIRKYSRNAEEWKNFQKLFEAEYYSNKEKNDELSNKVHIKQQAKRLVIGEIFSDLLNEGDILTPTQLNTVDYRIGDISRDFGLDIDLDEIKCNKTRIERIEDYAFRIINMMHSSIQDMQAFVQDIIDNYTVDYLRKEKIFLLQQDVQNEYISKKKEYENLIEKLSYDKAKDSAQQIAYYQAQIDELTQKIGSAEYRDAKNDLLKSKNNFRVLLLNSKTQKELVKAEIKDAREKALINGSKLTIDETLEIIKRVLNTAKDMIITFDKGKATYYTRSLDGNISEKQQEKLSNVDKIIEETASKISDESHQKILEENRIRESIKKSQKEERIKSVNAYINAYGSIVGNAGGIGAFGGMPVGTYPDIAPMPKAPTFAQAGNYGSPINLTHPQPTFEGAGNGAGGEGSGATGVNISKNLRNAPLNNIPYSAPVVSAGNAEMGANGGSGSGDYGNSNPSATNFGRGNNFGQTGIQGGSQGGAIQGNAGIPSGAGAQGGQTGGTAGGNMQSPINLGAGYAMPGVMGSPSYVMPGMAGMPQYNPNILNRDYTPFDSVSEGIEPCVIPFLVGYENKGATTYGNMLEEYATLDRYKFLLNTNNNVLYSYIETKKAQIQSPEQIISDLHIRYVKNAMAKSGLSTPDSNLQNFDYKQDTRKFLTKYVPQNMLDIVISDYNDLINSCDFDLLRDLIEHRFKGDLEGYIPEKIKTNIVKCAEMIATLVKSISSDPSIRTTYEEYSSKMKQTYVSSLISKIESGAIPSVKLDSDSAQSRLIDYLSFSIKGQNVIIQDEDEKDCGFGSYPRSIYFKQKEYADTAIKFNKTLSYEQNEIVTTRNENLDLASNVVNLFGVLYKFNGGYNKLLLKLKPYYLQSGVKFMENIVDALREKINLKTTVIVEEDKKPVVPLVKFASKEREKLDANESVFNYDDDRWYVRKGFVLDKQKVKEYALLLALGRKYALDKEKTALKEDFYDNNILSLNKINEKFKDSSEEFRGLVTYVIRTIMMSRCERYIDFIDQINKDSLTHFNRMLYINKMIMESNSFDRKNEDEKKETIESLEEGFNTMTDDLVNPHPEIYSSIEDIEHYERLYLYYALSELFNMYPDDERIVSPELTEYFADKKKEFRTTLLAMIRDHQYMNGYEIEMAEYFELNTEKVVSVDQKLETEEDETEEKEIKIKEKIKNIDVIFKGIYDGFEKAVKDDRYAIVQDEVDKCREILSLVGTLPSIDSEEKDLEIALPNNQTIFCNIKGFVEQYLFRYIIDKEHELGPFAYVVKELEEHEELKDTVKNLEEVANILSSEELGINLIAKFSSINLSNNGNIFKIGDNISTVVETVNRLKTPTDMQKALNRDVFYKEGVTSVQKAFEQYFNRRKIENLK